MMDEREIAHLKASAARIKEDLRNNAALLDAARDRDDGKSISKLTAEARNLRSELASFEGKIPR
jgi:hypothetical protein